MSGAGRPAPEDVPFVAASDGAEATVFSCGLCGLAFSHGERACTSCTLGAGCDLVRCPRCGYQFPRRSRIADLGRRLLQIARRRSA
jgi:hypothetical protein